MFDWYRKAEKKKRKVSRKLMKDSERIRKEVFLHAEGLAAEMTLRLFLGGDEDEIEENTELPPDEKAFPHRKECLIDDKFIRKLLAEAGLWDLWRDLCAPDTVLIVENVEIVDICFSGKKQRRVSGLL